MRFCAFPCVCIRLSAFACVFVRLCVRARNQKKEKGGKEILHIRREAADRFHPSTNKVLDLPQVYANSGRPNSITLKFGSNFASSLLRGGLTPPQYRTPPSPPSIPKGRNQRSKVLLVWTGIESRFPGDSWPSIGQLTGPSRWRRCSNRGLRSSVQPGCCTDYKTRISFLGVAGLLSLL